MPGHTHADHVEEANARSTFGARGSSSAAANCGGQADAVVELPQRQQAGIRGERGVADLDLDGQRLESRTRRATRGKLIGGFRGRDQAGYSTGSTRSARDHSKPGNGSRSRLRVSSTGFSGKCP